MGTGMYHMSHADQIQRFLDDFSPLLLAELSELQAEFHILKYGGGEQDWILVDQDYLLTDFLKVPFTIYYPLVENLDLST